MGKRNKEPQVGRRRPMIQLGGSNQKSGIGVVSRNVLKEEEKERENKEKTEGIIPDEIEDQLAGFLAEINSLDDTPGCNNTEETSKQEKICNSGTSAENLSDNLSPLYDVSAFDPATESHLLPENWQAIYDESTSYYYYWNTVTNEVQWFPPDAPVSSPPPPPLENELNELSVHDEKSPNIDIDNTSEIKYVNVEQENNALIQTSNTDNEYGNIDTVTIYVTSKNNVDMLSTENNNQNINLEHEQVHPYIPMNDLPSLPDESCISQTDLYARDAYEFQKYGVVDIKEDIFIPEENGINKRSDTDVIVDNQGIENYQCSSRTSVSMEIPKDECQLVDQQSSKHNDFNCNIDKIISTDKKDIKSCSIEKSSVDEQHNINKDKDKELMNKIKEKIQKKKEEKLRKIKEEMETKMKEEELLQQQKAKEEMLREKLIKKKYEREKALTADLITNSEIEKNVEELSEDNEIISTVTSTSNDMFSVDMFASEESYKTPVDHVALSNNLHQEIPVKKVVEKDKDIVKIEEKPKVRKPIGEEKPKVRKPIDVVGENSTKEKGGWRIIDAVYDDDDDDDEDEDEVDDEETNNTEETEPPIIQNEDGAIEKGTGEMDDYAEMLLEGAIGEIEETRRTKRKRKKSKYHFIPAPLPLEAPPPPPPEPEMPPLPPEDEPAPQIPEAPAEEKEHLKEDIQSTSSILLEKLNVLGITSGDCGKLQICLIELETRLRDWLSGALDSKYFLDRLKEADVEILKHEEATAPAGWISHWSSNFKMYYYYNAVTGQSQWDYPSIPLVHPMIPLQPAAIPLQSGYTDYQFQQPMTIPPNEIPAINENDVKETEVLPATFSDPPPPPPPETTAQITVSASAASLVSPAHGFSREPIPVESRKRPVSSDNEKSADPYRDPYRLSKKKKETPISKSNTDAVNSDHSCGSSVSGAASPVDSASVITAGPITRETLSDITQDIAGQSFDLLVPPPPPPPPEDVPGMSPKKDIAAPTPVTKTKVKKRKKLETSSSKKLKHVSSLVQKWQTVKQQVEEEENVEEESDEDYETASERRINEWKKEMETSDLRINNPNFCEIKGDWRARLKRKGTT